MGSYRPEKNELSAARRHAHPPLSERYCAKWYKSAIDYLDFARVGGFHMQDAHLNIYGTMTQKKVILRLLQVLEILGLGVLE